MSGPWEDFKKQAQGSATEDAEGPWSDFKAPTKKEEPGLGSKILSGVVKAAETIDSYTGAPVRKGIGALQDGKGIGGALSEGASQFGEDPRLAPTGKDIRKKAGVDLGDITILNPDSTLTKIYKHTPMGFIPGNILSRISPNDAADFAIEAGADITNVLPVAKLGKLAGVAASKGATKAIDGAIAIAKRGEDAVATGGKFVLKSGLGAEKEAIERYISRHAVLKDKVGAKEMAEELAGELDQGLKPAREQLAAAEQAVQSAKARRAENLEELTVKRQEAKEALGLAEEQALGEAASRVAARTQQLNKEVSEGSAKAFDILDKEGVRVPTKKILFDMDQGAKALAERAVTDEQILVAENVKKYADRIRQNYPSDIPGGEAKRILQSLDREMSHLAPGEIGRLSKPDQIIGKLRSRIDEPLKGSQAYAEQMKGVASDTRLLMDAKNLSSESAAARTLRAASRATGKDQAILIQALEAKYGDKFLESVTRSNLPEYAKLKGVLQRYRAVKKGAGVKQSEQFLGHLQNEIGDATRLGDNGIAGISDNIKAYVRASDPKAVRTEVLKKAGQVSNIDMEERLKDIKTIGSFEKEFNRGSANTNVMGAIMGGLMGSVMGPIGAGLGVAGGAAFGRLALDSFGPAIARKILDAAPLLKKMSPYQWIKTLDVPAPVKKALEEGLISHQMQTGGRIGVAASKAGRDFRLVAEEEPKKGEDRWAQRGIEKLGIKDAETANRILQSKEGKRLLIEASDLPPGSKKLQSILEKLSKGWGEQYGNEPGTVPETEILRQQRRPSSGR